jgi:hypothetical protein
LIGRDVFGSDGNHEEKEINLNDIIATSLLTSSLLASAMLRLSARSRPAVRLAAGMATAAPRIGDIKVPMSLLEKGAFINYQRIEDNLAVVRKR